MRKSSTPTPREEEPPTLGSPGDPDHTEREGYRERERAAPHTEREEEPPTVGSPEDPES